MDGLVLVVGGVLGGLCGSIAGLASLFSYPALLAVGVSPIGANVTNTVALSFSTLGVLAGSRPELEGQAPAVRRYAPLTLVGGAVGAGLLLATPPGTFEVVVPFLVAGASVALLAQPRLQLAVADRRVRAGNGAGDGTESTPAPVRPGRPVVAGTLAIALYAGYFGAAAGVVMLALLGVVVPESWLRVNALKNVVMGLANVVAAVGFAVFGPVDWPSVAPLAAGILVGSAAGPAVARQVPTRALRIGVALAGIGLAVRLLLTR